MRVDLSDHTFYQRTRKKQNKILLLIGLTALGFNLLILLLSVFTGWYLIVLFTVSITLTIIAPFFDTPQMVKHGKLTYFSSLFLVEPEKNSTMVIHGGTLFDYYFVINSSLNGQQRTNFILQKFIEGLLNLTNSFHGNDPTLKIKGTSYILNERTLEKAGFTLVKTDRLQYVVLVWNYFNLTISLSLAKAKLTFPKLGNIVTFEAELSSLINRKNFLEGLNSRLKN